MAVCKYHPERPGVGVCVRCRAVVCAACSTKLDGVNHCHACLRQLGGGMAAGPAARYPGVLSAVLTTGLAGLWFFLLAWLLAGLLGPQFP
jgi:hypothetical protein